MTDTGMAMDGQPGAGALGQPGAGAVQGSESAGPAWSSENTNAAAGAFLDAFFVQLGELGVRDVVVSPGSRSTPLAMKAYEHFGDVFLDVDERGAGFVALGMAKASGRPVAVVATSGSAIGNWMPAVLEAESSNVPVLFLSSDRPARLQGVGAPQTTDQVELFGGHVRLFRQMPDPNVLAGAKAGVGTAAGAGADGGAGNADGPGAAWAGWADVELAEAGARDAREAVYAALGVSHDLPGDGAAAPAGAGAAASAGTHAIPGPVHLNFPFDEPLKPAPRAELPDIVVLPAEELEQGAASGALGSARAPGGSAASPVPDPAVVRGILEATTGLRTVIVAGEGAAASPAEARAIASAADRLGMPILADPLSGLRIPEAATAIASYDSICTRPGQPAIDAIIRLGRWPVSKRLALAVMDSRPLHISVDLHQPLDFTGTSDFELRTEPAALLEALARQSEAGTGRRLLPQEPAQEICLREWLEADAAAEARIGAVRTEGAEDFEGTYVRVLLDAAPAGSLLWAANSMSIRALDTFMFRQDLRVMANRGLNGIDGTTSTFLGAALAHAGGGAHARAGAMGAGAGEARARAATFLTGDLTLLHDLNALALAPELARHGHAAPCVIVCLNNAGGAIFDMLPQRSSDPYFERLFLTPQSVDFAGAATLFGLAYERPAGVDSFVAAYREALERPGITLIDVALPLAGMPERYERYW